MSTEERWIVRLPPRAQPPYRVFVNGVPQTHGVDYELRGHALHFGRELKKEGRLGFWPWLLMFLSIRGVYRQNDSVDVQYRHAGRERVATGLEIIPPEGDSASGS